MMKGRGEVRGGEGATEEGMGRFEDGRRKGRERKGSVDFVSARLQCRVGRGNR
jgi:hypothetical protein